MALLQLPLHLRSAKTSLSLHWRGKLGACQTSWLIDQPCQKKNPLIFICLEPRLQTKQFGWILTCEQLHLFSKLSKWWDNIIIIH
ncbi:hypothetical protein Pelo_4374 [Pelomyxa schiedti]|nr:hypothetical protein Pelo_4374 [Pelomyxa schiedti]